MTMQGDVKFSHNLEELKSLRKDNLEKLIQALRESDQFVVIAQKDDGIAISIAWETENIPNLADAFLEALGNVMETANLQAAKDSGTGPEFNT